MRAVRPHGLQPTVFHKHITIKNGNSGLLASQASEVSYPSAVGRFACQTPKQRQTAFDKQNTLQSIKSATSLVDTSR